MAVKGFKGSIILEILIILMALLLVAVIIVPNQIWETEDRITSECRHNMNSLYEAERFYYQKNNVYTDSLSKVLNFIQADSGLNRRQTLVSLTNSFTKVLNNILLIPSIENISIISQGASEITQDLKGNERYFRKYEDIDSSSKQIVRELSRLDSSANLPNFSRTKLFVDSLRDLKESVSDHSLQVAILRAINSVDSLTLYYPKIEKITFEEFWQEEHTKISAFINRIRTTDISQVSTVPERLKKFIDQINTNVQLLKISNAQNDLEKMEVERQNLTELHQKFLSPEYFMLTKRYSLTKLNETDSILINLSQNNFTCPDAKTVYIIDSTNNRLTVECPNLLGTFHEWFMKDIEPIKNRPLYGQMDSVKAMINRTKVVLDENRGLLRRYTEILLMIKELSVEMDQMDDITFYRYVTTTQGFITLIDNQKRLSILKPSIEDMLNPLDTLSVRITNRNVSDLENQLHYFQGKLEILDSTVNAMRLPASIRRRVVSNVEPFKPVFAIVTEMKNSFDPAYGEAYSEVSDKLEKDLLHALEGISKPVDVIFKEVHINHGYIFNGEKSWEQEE
jgi:hypothetical protein